MEELTGSWVSSACTLPSAERPLRVAEFDGLFAAALRGVDRPAPTRLRMVLAAEAEEAARELTARETRCCSFFTFTFHHRDEFGVAMEVAVPAAHVEVLDALATRAAAAAGFSE